LASLVFGGEKRRILAQHRRRALSLVPTLRRRNAAFDAPRRPAGAAEPTDAERPRRRSHAERGNELNNLSRQQLCRNPVASGGESSISPGGALAAAPEG